MYLKRFSLLILATLLLNSCKFRFSETPKINLEKEFYWAQCDEHSLPEEVQEGLFDSQFKKLERMGGANLKELVGPYGSYIWLKADFTVPDELTNQPLCFYAQYIHFAEKCWINGHYLGIRGQFPPVEKGSMYKTHVFQIPDEFVNQEGNNQLLLKVWCHGDAEISKQVFIGNEQYIKYQQAQGDYFHSILYILFEGFFFASFMLYFFVYLAHRNQPEYFSFAMMCFFTTVFSTIFFASNVPIYQYLSEENQFLTFYKDFACISWYIMCYFLTSFIIHYSKQKLSTRRLCIRLAMLFFQIIVTRLAPSYNTLIKIFPYMLVASASQSIFTIKPLIKAHKEKISELISLATGLLIFYSGIGLDFILRILLKNTSGPYYTFIGWFFFCVNYVIVLIVRYNKVFKSNEHLTRYLQDEVESQTKQIKQSNAFLADELKRAKTDIEMAATVQQKMFTIPKRTFVGWDFAVTYEPLDIVSGDLFDFYSIGSMLDGFSIFDVSGHGISASLITMMAKNIIFQSFKQSRFNLTSMSKVLKDINLKITNTKGTVDNYLTGIICKFSPIDEEQICDIQFANAGHPYPLLYSAEKNEIIELKNSSDIENYGAIGLTGTDVNYVSIDFKMGVNDVLLMYTDGLTEALNKDIVQFGKERVKKIIFDNANKSSQQILNALQNGLQDFCGDSPRKDDITIIVFKRENTKDYLEAISDD